MAEGDPRPLVLVVDDDDAIRRLVRLGLSERFEVLEAASAAEAIELVQRHDVEVVVLDVMLPGMSGVEACPILKAKARGPLPVLLLTALGDQEHRNQGLEAGGDDYLTKPVDRRELLLRVQNFVRLRRQEQLIRRQLETLSQLQALKDDLTAMLVHDLRNPLTAAKSAFQLMERTVAEADQPVRQMGEAAVDRVMEATGDLLKVRMLEQGQLTLDRSSIALDALASEVVQTLRAAAIDGKVEVRVRADGNVTALVDAKLIKRALENLLINALRHTRETIDVVVIGNEAGVTLAVEDRGKGVPDFLKAELFDRFGSLALQKAGARRGHGLGLYLVRLVAQAHGGSVVVRDREGGGASFVMSLPRPPN